MDLKEINQKIVTENLCYEDLITRADVYRERGDWNIARELLKDAIKSINALQELEKRKQLNVMPHYLKRIGVVAKVVKRFAN
ncbi:hypothetical protein [Lysinibacillus halotolerans]|uniref:Uncharacterized protein n=1 Tax=Lysinibacillus halotolerans TaxID=1368476 RepID=A0A3M8H7I7_9BACI|nr:hypothetical protein [Lysinibacillus halotolerans]RNC98259.1 hypothetical protein EC501_11680 [Lysinibacillus halotolerans]